MDQTLLEEVIELRKKLEKNESLAAKYPYQLERIRDGIARTRRLEQHLRTHPEKARILSKDVV